MTPLIDDGHLGKRAVRALGHLRFARYRFTVEAQTPIALPPYKGSALRGALGTALRRTLCVSGLPECPGCPVLARCLYPYLFETDLAVPRDEDGRGAGVPRPFVLVPPLEGRRDYEPGERLSFDITLLGAATGYAAHVAAAVSRMGAQGIGAGRGRFRVDAIEHVSCETDAGSGAARRPHSEVCTGRDVAEPWSDVDVASIEITFLTPTRLKSGGAWVMHGPPFAVLFDRLLERIAAVSWFHHGVLVRLDTEVWRRCAQAIELRRTDVVAHRWTRYSNRQRASMPLDGFVGRAEYSGDMGPFLPLLAVGEWLHVGKNATFGLGHFRVALA